MTREMRGFHREAYRQRLQARPHRQPEDVEYLGLRTEARKVLLAERLDDAMSLYEYAQQLARDETGLAAEVAAEMFVAPVSVRGFEVLSGGAA